jgi:hypothetical protein
MDNRSQMSRIVNAINTEGGRRVTEVCDVRARMGRRSRSYAGHTWGLRWPILGAMALLLLVSCGRSEKRSGPADEGDSLSAGQMVENGLIAKPEWIRQEPIDLQAIDRDRDGYVWQCREDANVVADEAGACPNCSRKLERVDLDDADSRMDEQGVEARR